MKKYLVILVALVVVITGCGKKEEKFKKPEKLGNEEGLVLYYEDIAGSVAGSPTSKISLYTDKRMVFEHTDKMITENNTSKTITLTEEEYKKITDSAFSEEFLTLNKDLTSMETAGGVVYYITVYYDNTSFTTGGQNINDKTFNNLKDLLVSYNK